MSKYFLGVLIGLLVIAGLFLYRFNFENNRLNLENKKLKNELHQANANIEGANDTIRDAKSWGVDRTDELGQALNGLKEEETVPPL